MPNPNIDLLQLTQVGLAGLLLVVLVGWCVIATVLAYWKK